LVTCTRKCYFAFWLFIRHQNLSLPKRI
jgi:hypothetical protein